MMLVGADLDRIGQPAGYLRAQPDRDGRPAGQGFDRGPKTAVGKDRRMKPAGDLPDVFQRLPETVCDTGQFAFQFLMTGRD